MQQFKTLLAAFVLLLVLPGIARAAAPAAVTKALKATYADAQADAVIVEETRTYTLAADGTTHLAVHRLTKLLTDNGIDEYGDPRILRDTATETLTVETARVWLPGGGFVDTKANGKNDTTPDAVAKAPDYMSLQEMVVTHVGIVPGAVTELAYTIDGTTPAGPLYETIPLVDERAVDLLKIVVEVPEGTPLAYRFDHTMASKPFEESVGATTRYTFTIQKLPATNLHEAQATELPQLVFSTIPDAKAHAAMWYGLLKSGDPLAPVLGTIIADAHTPLEKVAAIAAHVRDGLGHVELSMGDQLGTARPASVTLASGYGHDLDKAIALYGLLDAAGLDPAFVVLTAAKDNGGVESPSDVVGLRIKVKAGGATMWLDPSGTGSIEELHVAGAFQVTEGGFVARKLPKASLAKSGAILGGSLSFDDEGGLTGTITVTLMGMVNPYQALLSSMGKDEPADLVAPLVSAIAPSLEVATSSVVTSSETGTTITCTVKSEPLPKGPVRLALPSPMGILAAPFGDLYRPTRDTPLWTKGPFTETVSLTVTPPEGGKVLLTPKTVAEGTKVASSSIEVSLKDGTATVVETLQVKTDVVQPSEYQDFKEVVAPLMGDAMAIVVSTGP